MKILEMYKAMWGVFRLPHISIKLQRERGYPYFLPMNYSGNILSIRKLKLKSEEQYQEFVNGRSWLDKLEFRFVNLPIVRRSKYWITNIFGNYYWIQIGWPISISFMQLGWKDKYNTPRFEWCPSFNLYFFGLQFQILFQQSDSYWEQFLWYYYYSDKDIVKAKETWPWVSIKEDGSRPSSWRDEYVKKL